MDTYMGLNRNQEYHSGGGGASHSENDGNQKVLIDMRAIKV